MPVMWTISTAGYSHIHFRIATASALDSSQTSQAAACGSWINGARWSCRPV